jgi:hypothetical protein
MGSLIRIVENKFVDLLDSSGFADIVGGRAALEEGFRQWRAEAVILAAELDAANERNETLAQAVFDTQQYPHLVRAHGWLTDILNMAVPTEILPWVRKVLAIGPSLENQTLQHLLATLAFRSPNPAERALGKFMLFETLCFEQRMALLATNVDVEVVGGQPEKVETIATEEIAAVEQRPAYQTALLSLDDPLGTLRVLVGASMARLNDYVETLRAQVKTVGQELHQRFVMRKKILDTLAKADPADAVLIRNANAGAFESERVTVEELRLRHPGLLGDLSPSNMRKRLERALSKPFAAKERQITFGQLLVQQLNELEG